MHVAFPGESAEYRAARDLLLGQEIELRRAMEDVAAARRARKGAVVTTAQSKAKIPTARRPM